MTDNVIYGSHAVGMIRTADITITPRGPFSWGTANSVLGTFPPTSHHFRAGSEVTRLAFPLDGDFTPVAVALWEEGGVIRGEVTGSDRLDLVAAQAARVYSLDHDGSDFPEVAFRDPRLAPLIEALPGLRPICFTSPYETAAWAIISQRIRREQAAAVRDRLIREHGHPLLVAGETVNCFPTPRRLLTVDSISGLPSWKVQRLHGVARAALEGLLDVDRLRALGPAAPASVLPIPGIGPFWSQGIWLRGCGVVDVFPDEPVSIAALGRLHGLGDRPPASEVERLTDAFRPFRMWVCFLLRVAAGRRGLIPGVFEREGELRRGRSRMLRR